MKRITATALLGFAFLLILPTQGEARVKFKRDLTQAYPALKGTALDSCKTCHTKTPELNPYGEALKNSKIDFAAVEKLDSDGDKVSNLHEIHALTSPGDPADCSAITAPAKSASSETKTIVKKKPAVKKRN